MKWAYRSTLPWWYSCWQPSSLEHSRPQQSHLHPSGLLPLLDLFLLFQTDLQPSARNKTSSSYKQGQRTKCSFAAVKVIVARIPTLVQFFNQLMIIIYIHTHIHYIHIYVNIYVYLYTCARISQIISFLKTGLEMKNL